MQSANPPPLTGLKVLEFAGLAPGPYAGLLLADAGASVLRIDKPAPAPPTNDLLTRHKTSIAVDLKSRQGHALILQLARHADVLIDPYRPGVMEKLGLGPDQQQGLNPSLIYARMTGFRRSGRYAHMAGHDINYLAVSGTLALLGRADQKPTPPLNILGDFAGGGASLVQGILLALLARDGGAGSKGKAKGQGQIVHANMVDGANHLATFSRLGLKTPAGAGPRGTNLLDSGCPFYDTYETGNKQYMAVGALEPQFYAALLHGLGLAGQGWEERRLDRACWDEMRGVFARVFKTKTRAAWEAVFDGTDACCTPVLDYEELEEAQKQSQGDQRPLVALGNTPLLAVDSSGPATDAVDVDRGQGPGVQGDGYVGQLLLPGEGGQDTLKHWLGWKKGVHFDVHDDGSFVLKTTSKL
ncbi:putative alpha-methylacyl-CoA racemase [Coniella lustricola]|uniref:Putative alpha-methylacyl-CoA racemase n=1 Tax=Coniella lustricola TaxID=2025994 RepID=A0A2T2ZZG3_9PEZI|nr:putative alpha-methylacyl-CoA racemase [Coniella lustricola]